MALESLDEPARIHELRALIERKPALKQFYAEVYGKYEGCLSRCPRDGIVLELGSGASFVKTYIPNVLTSDVIAYPGVDRVVDATKMPFEAGSLRAILMMNVFHHIPDVGAFLHEASRCLKPGGRIFMLDQNVSWFSQLIYRYAHHEPFDPAAIDWSFETTGPLSGANGALASIVFRRDRARFEREYPALSLDRFEPHTPLRYWLAGGLKAWTLLPGWAFPLASRFEEKLLRVSTSLGCFVDVEIVKRGGGAG